MTNPHGPIWYCQPSFININIIKNVYRLSQVTSTYVKHPPAKVLLSKYFYLLFIATNVLNTVFVQNHHQRYLLLHKLSRCPPPRTRNPKPTNERPQFCSANNRGVNLSINNHNHKFPNVSKCIIMIVILKMEFSPEVR